MKDKGYSNCFFGGGGRGGAGAQIRCFMDMWKWRKERFYPRGPRLCKFIGTKESVGIRKEFNSHRTGLGHQYGRRFIVLGHQYGRREIT